jgi:hypothetical protein
LSHIPQSIHNPSDEASPFTQLHRPNTRQRDPASTRGGSVQHIYTRTDLGCADFPQLLQQSSHLIRLHEVITGGVQQHGAYFEPVER